MENKSIKYKLNRLLHQYPGKTMNDRLDSMAKDLHIKRRWLKYLLKGEKAAGYHLADFINRFYDERQRRD